MERSNMFEATLLVLCSLISLLVVYGVMKIVITQYILNY
jgi:hypothetical protein